MASEDQDLLDRIGRVAGHINLQKAYNTSLEERKQQSTLRTAQYRVGSKDNTVTWRNRRSSPYYRGRGQARAGRISHRNRTLVLNNVAAHQHGLPGSATESGAHGSQSTTTGNEISKLVAQPEVNWVSKHDRHMQLINSVVFDREAKKRNEPTDQLQYQKAKDKNNKTIDKRQLLRHPTDLDGKNETPVSISTNQAKHIVSINNLRFQVVNGGSKLLRLFDPSNTTQSTPKQAEVGGVLFLRSKKGNMYRSGLVKAKKVRNNRSKILTPCVRFTKTGYCDKGPACPYIHDPSAVAICLSYLQRGNCPSGDSCDLSHDPTPERVPACLHFLRGKCRNDSCRYAHVRVNPSAPVCRDFAILGYCGKGANCDDRHVHECPDYAKTGICYNDQCALPHVDRAGQIRKYAANNIGSDSKISTAESQRGTESDLTSDDDDSVGIDSDSIESLGLDDDLGIEEQALSEQNDFVPF